MGCVTRQSHAQLPLFCLAKVGLANSLPDLPGSPCCIYAFTLPCWSSGVLQPCKPVCSVSAISRQIAWA